MDLKEPRDLPITNRLFHHIPVTVHQRKMFFTDTVGVDGGSICPSV